MGTSLTWLVARRESSVEDVLNRRGGRAISLQGPWMVLEFPLEPPTDEARLVEESSAASGEPCLGIHFQDGDFAIVMLAVPRGELSYVVLQPDLAEEYEEGTWALARAPHGHGWNEHAETALRGWAEAAGLTSSREALGKVLAARSVDVVEDAEELLVALGLPRLPKESSVYQGALTIEDRGKMQLFNGRWVDTAKVPYVGAAQPMDSAFGPDPAALRLLLSRTSGRARTMLITPCWRRGKSSSTVRAISPNAFPTSPRNKH